MNSLPLKAWVMEEAARAKRSMGAIYNRIKRGKYPWLPVHHVNKRVVFVDLDAIFDWMGEGPGVQAATSAPEKETLKSEFGRVETRRQIQSVTRRRTTKRTAKKKRIKTELSRRSADGKAKLSCARLRASVVHHTEGGSSSWGEMFELAAHPGGVAPAMRRKSFYEAP